MLVPAFTQLRLNNSKSLVPSEILQLLRGTLKLICPSVCPSVRPSVCHKNFNLAHIF